MRITKRKDTSQTRNTMTVNHLKSALADTQETIRAFDIKSEILAVVLTLLISLINLTLPEQYIHDLFQAYLTAAASVTGLLALLFIGLVLYPGHNPTKLIDVSGTSIEHTFYVSSGRKLTKLAPYLEKIKQTHWETEIAYEILKTSAIRDRKRYWFRWSLALSGLTILIAITLVIGNIWYGQMD